MDKRRSDIDFYKREMDRLQAENANMQASILAERHAIEEERRAIEIERCAIEEERREAEVEMQTMREELKALKEKLQANDETSSHLQDTIATQAKELSEKNAIITNLTEKWATTQTDLMNALANTQLGKSKQFAPSSEKMSLINKDRTDKRQAEKQDFDGSQPSVDKDAQSDENSDSAKASEKLKKERKKSTGRKPTREEPYFDEEIRHPISEYFQLPEGAKFKTKNGLVETHEYITYNYIPGKIIKNIWETASYVDASGDTFNTLPATERSTPVAGCPFTLEMLAFILVEKYAYHQPKNRIKRKLRDMGATFTKSTFVRYYQLAEQKLIGLLKSAFEKSMVEGNYLMIDETTELVGVWDSDAHPSVKNVEYRKRYLWAFTDPVRRLVYFLYEKGSRARDVLIKFLKDFIGTISTDGYGVYRIYETEEHPYVLHCGCWAHARRKFVEARGVATVECDEFLGMIQDLFANEKLFSGLDKDQRREKRVKLSRPVINRIFAKAEAMAKDTILMGKELFKKAVNYIRNQQDSLRNILLDGIAELSNNIAELHIRPIKLDLKNCQNIGSEEAAERAAFMHSLIESCKMNDINPYDYLVDLFRKLKDPLDDDAKRRLLPDQWQPQC